MDKFKLWKKWFWVGIVVGFLNGLAGLIYGIALMVEPEYRKEGAIIAIWSVLVGVAVFLTSAVLFEPVELPEPTL